MAKKKLETTAGVAGVGGGTSLLGIAALLPPDWVVTKAFLTYVSPAASVAGAYGLIHGRQLLNLWICKRQLRAAVAEARGIRDEVHRNPNSSAEHKQQAQENVEMVERIVMEVIKDNTDRARAVLKETS